VAAMQETPANAARTAEAACAFFYYGIIISYSDNNNKNAFHGSLTCDFGCRGWSEKESPSVFTIALL